MIPKRRVLFTTLILLVIFVILTNYYFMAILSRNESEVRKFTKLTIEEKILQNVPFIAQNYKSRRIISDNLTNTFIHNLKSITVFKNKSNLWKEARSWVSKTQLYNYASPHLGSVLFALKSARIIKADIDTRGTQLKLLLTLEVSWINLN